MGDLSEHFSRNEFRCQCGSCEGHDTVDYALLEVLEALRQELREPVIISSAHRCRAHNEAVGGARHSQHLLGRAVDVVVGGVSPNGVAAVAEEIFADLGINGGIGIYEAFTHIDTRTERARW